MAATIITPDAQNTAAEATIAQPGRSAGITTDDFQALEQKVLKAVEIVRREREARAAAEAEVQQLREQVNALTEQLTASQSSAHTQIATLNQERDAVRLRVEKMLEQMDELL